jgi:anti-sigma factor RsiW
MPVRDCPEAEIRDMLPDFVSGALDPAAHARVRAHVDACDACADEVRLLRATRPLLRRPVPVDVSGISRAVASSRRVVRRRPAWGWQRAAAIVALTIGGAAAALGVRARLSVRAGAPQPTAPAGIGVVGAAAEGGRSPPASPAGSPAGALGDGLVLVAGVQDLDNAELESVLADVESLDATPSGEPGPVLPELLTDGGI